jgi:hypothetical protein
VRNRFLTKVAALGVAACMYVPAVVKADSISIQVIPASAPNTFGSPSYAGWVTNAVNAIENNQATMGTAGTPTYYSQSPSVISVKDNIVTNFNSWKGVANPGAPFGSELGNRLQFGVHILGGAPADLFSISQLSFQATSDDATNSLGFGFAAGSYNYSAEYVGIYYGGDGVKDTGDDVRITSGVNTQLVNEIVGRGSGNAWAVLNTSPGATLQEKIDIAAGSLGTQPINFTGTYTLAGFSGAGSVTMQPTATAVPLPLVAPAGLAVMGAVALKRRVRAC